MEQRILKNPITPVVNDSIERVKDRIAIAVPYISSFARSVLNSDVLLQLKDKRLVTRFDETNIHSFELPTLKYLIDHGFQIRFCNSIHLKLYIFDNEVFVTSSNLTRGGFEDNIELTVKIDSSHASECFSIFDELWDASCSNVITKELLKVNWPKYEFLKKREALKEKSHTVNLKFSKLTTGSLDTLKLLDAILRQKADYSNRGAISYNANKRRDEVKQMLLNGFDPYIFYAPEDHPLRRKNLFYDFVYGFEKDLAGTGLREAQFKAAFQDEDFKNVISFMFPEMHSSIRWNFEDHKMYNIFCNGIFDFRIQQYVEVLPIRLASYFYPEYFIPIFVLNDLEKICSSFGFTTDANARGDKLFAYNVFIKDITKAIPYDNHVKSHIAYQILYTVELHSRLNNKESFEAIKAGYKSVWEKDLIDHGRYLLSTMNVI